MSPTTTSSARPTSTAVRVGARSAVTMALASTVGLLMFAWPLVLVPAQGADRVDPPFVFLVLFAGLQAVPLDVIEAAASFQST